MSNNIPSYLIPEIDSLLPRAKDISGRPSWVCPFCGNGSGADGTGIQEDLNNPGHYKCFKPSCDFYGDIWDIADKVNMKKTGESYAEAYKEAQRTAGAGKPTPAPKTQETLKVQKTQETQETEKPHFKEYIEKCAADLPGSEGESYLKDRGFTEETIKKYQLGYDRKADMVIIPYPEKDYYIGRYLYKKTTDKNKYYKPPKELTGISEPVFNAAALTEDYSYIMEGQLDALSIIQAGGNAAAVGGGGTRKLEPYLESLAEHIYILADNDEAGEGGAQKLQEKLSPRTKAQIVHPPKDYKDANEFLKSDPGLIESLVKNNSWKAWEYRENSSAAALINEFWDNVKSKTPAIRTGFKKLDAALDGGIYEGLTVLGAGSSMGKTTFCLQIADQIARYEQQDVLIFSIEMSKYQLIARSISRLSRELCGEKTRNAKTSRSITDPERIAKFTQAEKDLINQATDIYKDFAKYIWINEGIGTIGVKEIQQGVEEHIEATGRKPLVLVDYLQILASPDPRMSDKQAADRNVTDLKRLSREYKIPIIAIASFNRENYTTDANPASFKETGNIEYGGDVLMALQPRGMSKKGGVQAKAGNAQKIDDCKKSKKREVEIKILKNREAPTGLQINFEYEAMFNFFKESDYGSWGTGGIDL